MGESTASGDKPPRVFVSHHSSKAAVADQVEGLLSQRGIRCWIAPRDVPPGTPFDSAIQDAIQECSAVLLLFCANSDRSRHVKRELILGDSAGRPIIPLRLEAIDPGELAYHLADSQWIDWIDGREAVMDRVAAQVRLFAGAPAPTAPMPPVPEAQALTASDDARPGWVIPALGGALALALAVIGFLAFGGGDEDAPETATLVEAGEVEETEDTPLNDATGDEAETGPEESADDPEPSEPVPPVTRPTGLVARPLATPTPSPSPPARAPTQIAAAPVATQPLQRVVLACRGAGTDTEYLICANPDLDALAGQVGTLYRSIRDSYPEGSDEARAVLTEQRSWYNSVKAECSSRACVQSRYTARISELRGVLAARR